MTARHSYRRGSSYLEIQVSMILLAIGMAGLYSMSVVQTKHTARLSNILPANEIAALNRAPTEWARKLGVYSSVDAAVVPNDPLLPHVYVEQVIDNLSGAPSVTSYKNPLDTYDWNAWTYSPSYLGNSHYHRSEGNTGSYFQFQVTGLPIGEYEVLVTYPPLFSLGSGIVHQIYDGGTLRSSVVVNQKVGPSEVTYGGSQWDRLAVVQVDTGVLRVRLQDGPASQNYILADAVLIRSARSFDLLSVSETAGGGATATLQAP